MAPVTDSNLTRGLREQYKNASNLNARIRLHSRYSTNSYGLLRWLFDHLDLPSNARILELGAGTALLWRQNADRIPPGWRTTLSDFSSGMLREARGNVVTLARPFTMVQADAQELPFTAASFEAVIANHMLYHVRDIPSALREIHRVLVRGGVCYAATLGRGHLAEFDAIVQRFLNGVAINRARDRFGLENGCDLMRAEFGNVELMRYPDALLVTEVEPLIDYVNSTSAGANASAESKRALGEFLAHEIAARGAIRVSKDAGLLISKA
jgi:SAM-dependent methyltransferase